MVEQTRMAWRRPELIVLVRSGPGEAVLSTCKMSSVSYPEPTPNTYDQSCLLNLPVPCTGDCLAVAAS